MHAPASQRRIDRPSAAIALFAPLARAREEIAAFAYLDARWRLLGMRHAMGLRPDSADIPMRAVVGDALAFDARAVVMAHNHPGGDPTPTPADRDATRQLAQLLGALDIRLVDHLVLARGGVASLRALGLL